MIQRFLTIGLSVSALAPCAWAEEARPAQAKAPDANAVATSSAPAERGEVSGVRAVVYKKTGDRELKLYLHLPPGHEPTDKRPVIVFFFGGGWRGGSAEQFMPQCRYFASRGMVAAAVDYRVYSRDRAMIADCTADAQAAIRWVRAHARELGVDPDRITAAGGSAGGHLAAATGTVKDFTHDKKSSISFRPNAMVLFNPAIDLSPDQSKAGESVKDHLRIMSRMGARPEELSPTDNVRPGVPPTIIFHGRQDPLIPFAKIEAFAQTMEAAGNRCEVVGFEGQKHGFFNIGKSDGKYFVETLRLADRFLASLGYLKGEPTIDADMVAKLLKQGA
ncbi:MAG: alpha/beta hydrolase [Phycisphaerae bacterium]|nr:alpha/beta hydrolase [Phycisphaerae bacterium]